MSAQYDLRIARRQVQLHSLMRQRAQYGIRIGIGIAQARPRVRVRRWVPGEVTVLLGRVTAQAQAGGAQ